MKLDFSELITKLKTLETEFNKTEDPIIRFAIIETINHIGEKEIPVRDFWYDQYRKATLRKFGGNPDADPQRLLFNKVATGTYAGGMKLK